MMDIRFSNSRWSGFSMKELNRLELALEVYADPNDVGWELYKEVIEESRERDEAEPYESQLIKYPELFRRMWDDNALAVEGEGEKA